MIDNYIAYPSPPFIHTHARTLLKVFILCSWTMTLVPALDKCNVLINIIWNSQSVYLLLSWGGSFCCLQSLLTLKWFKVDDPESLCVCVHACVCVCVCVCLSLTSDSLETVKVIFIKFGTVTASDMRMHHMLIILTFTFIHGHADLYHENINVGIISGTIKAMPIKFVVKIVWLKVYVTIAILITLTFIQGHKCVSNLTLF